MLATRARIYYGMYGLVSTARKILMYLVGRSRAQPASSSVRFPFTGLVQGEITIPHAQHAIASVGPIQSGTTIAQFIELGFDSLHELELLLGTYNRSNTNKNCAALYSEVGELLHYEEFRSDTVADNQFHAFAFSPPIRLKQSKGVWLVLSSDGDRHNCITAWKSEAVSTGLFAFAESFETVRDKITTLKSERTALLTGTLVYRIRGARSAASPVYSLPPCPDDFEHRLGKDRLRTAAYVAGDSALARTLCERLEAGRIYTSSSALDALVEEIEAGEVDVVLLSGIVPVDDARMICRESALRYVPSVYLLDETTLEHARADIRRADAGRSIPFEIAQALCWTAFCAADQSAITRLAAQYKKRVFPASEALDARAIVAAYRQNCRPSVSIVTILYRKAAEITAVLDSYVRQTYCGPLEVVFVDDCSPDDSVRAVEEYVARAKATPEIRLPDIRIVRNERNAGNCISRNNGIAHARGDLLIIVDADCVLNREYVQKHVEAHAFDDCEVVIGPLNIETNGRDPREVLRELEKRADLVSVRCELQDPINPRSFLNCITRNFSIKRTAAGPTLFDPLFTYSEDPASGFGWEDIEMGYRLYAQGARIKFVDEAFSIHITPVAHQDDTKKALRSMRNFRRLFIRHPDLRFAARRWVVETTQKLLKWADTARVPAGEDRAFLESEILAQSRPIPWAIAQRPLRILTYRWHVPHQYELYKLPFEFTLVTGTGTRMCDAWEFGQRPMPANARFVPADKIDPRDYDLAILHFDENVLAPENTNGVIGPEWGSAFKWLHAQPGLPKIAVCHGTPQFYGQYDIGYSKPDLMQPIEAERQRLVDYLGDIPVVVNSHQAQREWGFRNSRVIWHGFDPAEFPPATYERGILSPLGPLVMSRPHYRGYFLYKAVFSADFPEQFRPETLKVPEPHVLYSSNAYAAAKYRNYVDEIRRYTVYFNPTLRSPMPRARGEPMMCGVVTVSARNHDVDMFVENGVNGFHSNDPGELREALLFLMRNPEAARRIGEAGRRTAMDVFNHDRYLSGWLALLENVLGSGVQRPALRLHAGGRR